METEFEYIILKSLTSNKEFFNKAIPILSFKHFVNIGNQEIFKIIKKYYQEYKEVAGLTEIISMVRKIENAEVRELIKKSLVSINTVKESKNIKFLADQTLDFVKDSMYLEALRIGSEGLMNCDEDLKRKAKEILDEMGKITIDSNLGLDFDEMEKFIEYLQQRNVGILTQHPQFNKRLGSGFIPGTLSLICAPAGIGKSLLMTDFISGWLKSGLNVLSVTLEMGENELNKRVVANALDLPINSLIDLSKTPDEKDELKKIDPSHEFVDANMIRESYEKLKNSGTKGKFFIKEFPSGSFSALQLEGLVESYKLEKGIEFDIILLDYIGIAKSDIISPSAGLYSYVKSIVEEFRATARKLALPIISASQLNRGAVNNKEASNDSISDSLGTIMGADWIVFLLQNEEMKARNEFILKVTKNRFNGLTDTWMMSIDYTRMRFNAMKMPSEMESEYEDQKLKQTVEDDFDIISPENMKKCTEYANEEVKNIQREALEYALRDDNKSVSDEDEISNLLAEMGGG